MYYCRKYDFQSLMGRSNHFYKPAVDMSQEAHLYQCFIEMTCMYNSTLYSYNKCRCEKTI